MQMLSKESTPNNCQPSCSCVFHILSIQTLEKFHWAFWWALAIRRLLCGYFPCLTSKSIGCMQGPNESTCNNIMPCTCFTLPSVSALSSCFHCLTFLACTQLCLLAIHDKDTESGYPPKCNHRQCTLPAIPEHRENLSMLYALMEMGLG